MRAKDIMTADVVTVSDEASIADAVQLMLTKRISGIPAVGKSSRLVGIITEGDLMRRAELQLSLRAKPGFPAEKVSKTYTKAHSNKVKDVMTRDVITVDEDEAPERIAAILEEHGIKRVPVVENGRIKGIVSRANLLRALAAGKTGAATPSDSQIKSRIITDATSSAGARLELVDVMVVDGAVHLWGNVASEAERKAIHTVAETTAGVKQVHNHLRVLPETTADYKFE